MNLYHGSPKRNLKELVFIKENQRFNELVEGEGVYCTDSFEVAENYSGGGSVYTVEFGGSLFDSTKKESFTKILNTIGNKYNVDFNSIGYIDETIESTVDGSYSVSEFGESINLLLDNDESFMSNLKDYDIMINIKSDINNLINSYDCIKYLDNNIDNGNSFVFLIKNSESIKIINELQID